MNENRPKPSAPISGSQSYPDLSQEENPGRYPARPPAAEQFEQAAQRNHPQAEQGDKPSINIVWLKRDIRTQDHLPLYLAEQNELPYLILFLFEPSLMAQPDNSLRHWQFQYHSMKRLQQKLAVYQKEVLIWHTEGLTALDALQQQFCIRNIFSYRESGTQITYDRDKEVASFCRRQQITWTECQRDGIQRGIQNREGWDKNWFSFMHQPIVRNTFSVRPVAKPLSDFPIPQLLQAQLEDYPARFQPAGEDYAVKYLESFVSERGRNYSRHISKPLASRTSCSRLSPYLSWGNISIRQAYQYVLAKREQSGFKGPLHNFLIRLKWHCHFIQKFEVDCSYETRCINAGYELLSHEKNEAYINAWKNGATGFPLVDACMKCLEQTGWINFRMRAMLVSFFCHHLYQDWREGTAHLARLFLDYEPGIHYPQFQMQAGTTGINTIRMYNPVKQSQDHDPEGVFIKQWLPQLRNIPTQFIHEPHNMTLLEQQLCGVCIGVDYPPPIVDLEQAGKKARALIWGHRKDNLVKEENERIVNTHTRKSKSRKKAND